MPCFKCRKPELDVDFKIFMDYCKCKPNLTTKEKWLRNQCKQCRGYISDDGKHLCDNIMIVDRNYLERNEVEEAPMYLIVNRELKKKISRF